MQNSQKTPTSKHQDRIDLVKLDFNNVNEAYRLTSKIFQEDAEHVLGGFVDALLPETLRIHETQRAIDKLDYYVATVDEKPVGITGFYTLKGEDPNEAWIGWFGVDSDFRGQGFGGELLNATIDMARKRGKKTLRLWTTGQDLDAPEEERLTTAANNMYEKAGFETQSTKFFYDLEGYAGRIPVLIQSLSLDGRTPCPKFGGDFSKVFVGCTDVIKEFRGKFPAPTPGIGETVVRPALAKAITTGQKIGKDIMTIIEDAFLSEAPLPQKPGGRGVKQAYHNKL